MLRDIYSNNQRHSKYRKFCKDAGSKYLGPNWDMPIRWNSTCTMFEKAIEQKESLVAFHSILANRGKFARYPASSWAIIEDVTAMLQVFKNSTTALSGVYYPTSSLVLHKLYLMCEELSKFELRGLPYSLMVPPMKEKLKKYFQEIPPVFSCAAALNPCLNVVGTESFIDHIAFHLDLNTEEDPLFSKRLKDSFNKSFSDMFDIYLQKYGQSSNLNDSMDSEDPNSDFELFCSFYNDANKRLRISNPSNELGIYRTTNFLLTFSKREVKNFDLLAWWKGKEDQFPILASMARDLLTVQASTVASESAFSISGRVISIRRTRLTALAVEMSICLKDYLDAVDRAQDKRSLEGKLDYEAELYEDEVEGGLTNPMTDEEAAFDEYIRNSSGSGED